MNLKLKCIERLKDNNDKIYLYKLIDSNGNKFSLSPDILRDILRDNNVAVVNLKLTSDNRIIEVKEDNKNNIQQKQKQNAKSKHTIDSILITRDIIKSINKNKDLSFKSNVNIDNIIYKAELLGNYNINKVNAHLIILENNTSIILASDIMIELERTVLDEDGIGTGLLSSSNFTSIDLSNVDTSKIDNMTAMFFKCKAKKINLGTIDTSNVTNMFCMFCNCDVEELDLSMIDVSKVRDMCGMFCNCSAKKVNLRGWKTPSVKDMSEMFCSCDVKELDLTWFNTTKVTNMSRMFASCSAKKIDISTFKTDNVKYMDKMFDGCNASVNCTDNKIRSQLSHDRKESNNK